VARAGGISKAAQDLHTVQSNVTQRIRSIEAELGVPLFHRHARGVTLTSAGERLLPYADRIKQLLAEAKKAAGNGAVPNGRVVIGALETATAVRLPPLLAAYAKRYPDVDIEIVTGTAAELITAVLERRVEAAFVAGPVEHPELVATPAVTEELVAVTAPSIASLDQLAAAAKTAPPSPAKLETRTGKTDAAEPAPHPAAAISSSKPVSDSPLSGPGGRTGYRHRKANGTKPRRNATLSTRVRW